jgi:7-carboxy-7-deazaguanine synthase
LNDLNLKITEIFYSLQGESRTVGVPTVFIRLTGCPLRCHYCDTAYAFQGGSLMSIDDILLSVKRFQPRFVTVTGGEPLAQSSCLQLLSKLCDTGYEVSLETSGALDIGAVDDRVVIVMDIKTPGSKVGSKNKWSNLPLLKKKDQIKFVICNRDDYVWAKKMLEDYKLARHCEVLFSPSHEELANQALADWIIEDNLPVRFQLQLHKYIWGNIPGK